MAGAGPNMSVKVVGLAHVVAALRATPKQVRRAARNAIDRSITFARREAVNAINADLKLSKKLLRDRLPTQRTRQTTLSASITANNKQLPMGAYKIKKTRLSKTRVSVAVRDTLYGPSRRSDSAFINPKHNSKRLIRRVKGAARLPLDLPAGPSVAVQFDILLDRAKYTNKISRFAADEFRQQLRRQVLR